LPEILEVLDIIKSIIVEFYNLTIIVIIIFSKGLLIRVISKLYNKNGNNILLSIASFIKAAKNLKVRVNLRVSA
jgi:TM2 domain-containing membrane protein YozV